MLARHFKIYTLTILCEGKSGFFLLYIYFFIIHTDSIYCDRRTHRTTKTNLVMDPSSEIRLS